MIVCQDISDPLNVGALFRLADALGANGLYCCGDTPIPPHRKISRTARSTEQIVPFVYRTTTKEALDELRQAAFRLIGLEITDQSTALDAYPFLPIRPTALVLGAESLGLSPETLQALDATVHIPMHGQNTSMNVVQAAAIALYEITRQWKEV